MQLSAIATVTLAALALTASSQAAILSVTGSAQLIPAPLNTGIALALPGANAPVVRAWNERFDFRLGGPLRVDAILPGMYDHTSKLGVWAIDRFTDVSSHFIHLNKSSTSGTVSGSITFDNNILGVICIGDALNSGSSLDQSDFLSSGTQYPDGLEARGLEVSVTSDRFSISSDHRTLNFWLDASTSSDSIRVITSVPAPGSLAMLALAGLRTSRRRR